MIAKHATESLEQQVYYEIRDMILSGELVSGQKLVQEDLAVRLGVSRTPLRSAISKLSHENFVHMTSRSEAFVAEFGPDQIADLFEMRAVLEGLICRLLAPEIERKHTIYLRSLMMSVADDLESDDSVAYRDADIEFHTYLANLMSERGFAHLLESVHSIMRMSLSQGILRAPAETHSEHLAIINALEVRDSDAAEQAMIAHIRKTIVLLREKSTQNKET